MSTDQIYKSSDQMYMSTGQMYMSTDQIYMKLTKFTCQPNKLTCQPNKFTCQPNKLTCQLAKFTWNWADFSVIVFCCVYKYHKELFWNKSILHMIHSYFSMNNYINKQVLHLWFLPNILLILWWFKIEEMLCDHVNNKLCGKMETDLWKKFPDHDEWLYIQYQYYIMNKNMMLRGGQKCSEKVGMSYIMTLTLISEVDGHGW